jgi:hypothetical protein
VNCLIRKKTKGKSKGKKGLMAVIDRFMLLSVLLPPGYLLYRFVRWYLKQDDGPQDSDNDEGI